MEGENPLGDTAGSADHVEGGIRREKVLVAQAGRAGHSARGLVALTTREGEPRGIAGRRCGWEVTTRRRMRCWESPREP